MIPANIESIGDRCFCDAQGVNSVTFAENSKLTTIEDAAFSGLTNIESIVLPSSVMKIGNSAFNGCTALTGELKIPLSVQIIGDNAFSNCDFECIVNKSSASIALPLISGQKWENYGYPPIEVIQSVAKGSAKRIDPRSSKDPSEIVSKNTYTVKYVVNDSDGGPKVTGNLPAVKNYYEDETYIVVEGQGNLRREGYIFKGWSINKNGTTKPYYDEEHPYTPKDGLKSNITFYAIWEEFQYWGFNNSNGNFGFISNGHQINSQDYEKLTKHLDFVTKQYIKYFKGCDWDGSCYGMSTSIALIKEGIEKSKLGLSNSIILNDVKTADPNCTYGKQGTITNDSAVGSAGNPESMINFFHYQQFLPEHQGCVYLSHKLKKIDRMNVIKSIVESTGISKPVVIFIVWYEEHENEDGNIVKNKYGHFVLGLKGKTLDDKIPEEKAFIDKGYSYRIMTYDPNYPSLTDNTNSYSNIYFMDNGDWSYNGIPPKRCEFICGTNDLSIETPVDYDTGIYNGKGTMPNMLLSNLGYQYVWGGNSVEINGYNIENNTSDYDFLILPECIGGNGSGRVRVYLPESYEHIIKGDKIDHELLTSDRLIWAKADQGGTATLNVSGTADIVSEKQGDMSLEIVDNEASGSVPPHFIIEANDVKELSEKKETDGIVVSSDDLLTLKITTDDNSVVCNPTEDKVLVKEENGNIEVFEDKNKDGEFEKEVETESLIGKAYTIVVGQKINLRKTCFGDVTESISRYVVDDKSKASISKEMLTGKKAGTVKVTAQKKIGKNQYENIDNCTITILSKPKLKFSKPMTYIGQTINATEFFQTEDVKTLGATYWESAKPSVVEVIDAKTGALEAKGTGTAKITAYFGEKGKAGTLKVSATIAVKVPSFQKSEYTMPTGGKLTLAMKNVNAALNPDWVTERNGIISATPQTDKKGNKTGKVILEGLAYGDTKLIATIDDQEYECTVHVVKPIINKTTMELKVGKTGTLSLKNTKLKKKDIVWKTDNPLIATVDANGKVKAESEGETVIYTEAGGVRSECTIKVNK